MRKDGCRELTCGQTSPGATHVTACECFAPVARSAASCLRANGMHSAIDLVHKASTEMKEGDLQAARRADIIVNELYDTELLGEGVLPTLRHALEHLAAPDWSSDATNCT
jgi:protein arginine N-methyltransferase 7